MPETIPSVQPRYRVLLWVGIAAFIVRFLYFTEHAASPFFHATILDEKFYDAVARALAEGRDASRLNPGFRPWLYPLFLAGWFRLGGEWGYVLAVCAQHLMGVATAVLVADLSFRLFRKPAAGALAGALYLLAGPPLFFEGELLITGLFTFLATAQLWILSHAVIGGSDESSSQYPWRVLAWWALAGAWTALAAQARPNMLLFLAAYPVAALVFRGDRPVRRGSFLVGALSGALVVLITFGALNQRLTGRFQLLGSSGGVNLYLGNKVGADGMVPRQDRQVTYGDEYRDSVQVFAEELYLEELSGEPTAGSPGADEPGTVSSGAVSSNAVSSDPQEISRYWMGRTLEEIAEDPWRWAGLIGRKVIFLVWNHEIPNNKSYDFIRDHESPLLNLMPVRWWLLWTLALFGLIYSWRSVSRQPVFWICAFLTLHAIGVVLFFVNSRYRIPMWPAMAVLAAGGLIYLIETLKRRSLPDTAVVLLTALGMTAISAVNWLRVEPPNFARDFFFRSLANMEKGRLEASRADARASVAIDSVAPAPRFHLGNVELALGDDDVAYRHFLVASYLSPPEPRIFNNLGIVIERRNRPGLAYRHYLRALEIAEDYAPALVNAALLELRAGLRRRAEEKIIRAERLEHESVLLLCARAFLERERGNLADARELLEIARAADPETVDRLIEENQKRLVPRRLDERNN